jgi:hypothetical protein
MNQKHSGPFIVTRQPLSRRHFLRGVGVAMSLPFLDVMQPGIARAAPFTASVSDGKRVRLPMRSAMC